MNNLFQFFIRHSSVFVLILYLIISIALLVNTNPYQQSVFLSSANSINTMLYEGTSAVSSYFGLKQINDELQHRNAALEAEVIQLRESLKDAQALQTDSAMQRKSPATYEYVVARVISNEIAQAYNYITINRGAADGIRPEMGIVDQNGVVGIVNIVNTHSARILSLLNPHTKISCKLKGSDFFGSLSWNGKSPEYAQLHELPKHGKYQRGDTVITSGYSAIFPEGIMVGTVQGQEKDFNGNFVTLRVKLSVDFSRLSTVRAIKSYRRAEFEVQQSNDENADEAKSVQPKNTR